MPDRYPVHRLVQKLQALAWSGNPVADHALADLETQVDLLLQLSRDGGRDQPAAPRPSMTEDHWPGEF